MKRIDADDFQDYIDELLEGKESEEVEFKSAKGGFPGSFWDTYSSFANTEGGTIVLGVKEKHGDFMVDDLSQEQIQKYKKEFWDNVNNVNHVNRCIVANKDVVELEYQGAYILIFYIPLADRTDRPIFRTTNPYNGTYKRGHEGDYLCTQKEVNRMFADADDSTPADSRILEGFSLADLDADSLKQYRQIFSISKPDHPWLALDDKELLTKLGGYRVDRKNGVCGFTLAGLLMFGKTESITDNECDPNYFVDYRSVDEDTETEQRWIDRIYPDGTWEANLFQFYRRVLPKLYSILPTPFQLSGDTRIDETPAHVAVREALVNLCIHSDYSVDASIVIEKHNNKIVFSNPGTLLISRRQYYAGGESVCRNKALQKMFIMLGKAEKAGSGVDKIMKGWEKQYWRIPMIETKSRPDKVNLTMSVESMLDDGVKGQLQQRFGDDVINKPYEQIITLATAMEQSEITNEMLRPILNMHRVDITALLKTLCTEGYLNSFGIGRGTKYRMSKVATSSRKVATSDEKVATSSSKVATSDADIATSENSTSHSKKLSKKELYSEICVICKEYTTLDNIASQINRSTAYLKNKIIKDMLKKHLIERLYEETPNHPNQQYRSIK